MDYSLLLGIHSSSKAIQNTGEIPNFDEPIEEPSAVQAEEPGQREG